MPQERPEPVRRQSPAAEQQDEPAAAPEPAAPSSLSREQQAQLRQKLAAKFH